MNFIFFFLVVTLFSSYLNFCFCEGNVVEFNCISSVSCVITGDLYRLNGIYKSRTSGTVDRILIERLENTNILDLTNLNVSKLIIENTSIKFNNICNHIRLSPNDAVQVAFSSNKCNKTCKVSFFTSNRVCFCYSVLKSFV